MEGKEATGKEAMDREATGREAMDREATGKGVTDKEGIISSTTSSLLSRPMGSRDMVGKGNSKGMDSRVVMDSKGVTDRGNRVMASLVSILINMAVILMADDPQT